MFFGENKEKGSGEAKRGKKHRFFDVFLEIGMGFTQKIYSVEHTSRQGRSTTALVLYLEMALFGPLLGIPGKIPMG